MSNVFLDALATGTVVTLFSIYTGLTVAPLIKEKRRMVRNIRTSQPLEEFEIEIDKDDILEMFQRSAPPGLELDSETPIYLIGDKPNGKETRKALVNPRIRIRYIKDGDRVYPAPVIRGRPRKSTTVAEERAVEQIEDANDSLDTLPTPIEGAIQ